MQRVAIVGLGLIGGSIGLGLKRWAADQGKGGSAPLQIVGFDTDLDQQSYAKKINAVDKTEWRLPNAIDGADIVILATPVGAMQELLSDIAPHLKEGAIVTDVGSTKADVIRWADEILPPTVSFVGGHPMAGKAISIEGADADLFKGATWIITPSVRADDSALRNVLGLVAALGAEAFFVDAAEHDAYVAGVSHLPFVLAATLTNALGTDSSWKDMKSLTAGGFKDMTRLASGSPVMHRDIVLTNRAAIVRWIDQFEAELNAVRDLIARESIEGREAEIEQYFGKARIFAPSGRRKSRGKASCSSRPVRSRGWRASAIKCRGCSSAACSDAAWRRPTGSGGGPAVAASLRARATNQTTTRRCKPGRLVRHPGAYGRDPCAGSDRSGSRSAQFVCPAD